MDDLVTLIAEKIAYNAFGALTPTETRSEVWATIRSVTRAEWAQAGQQGLNPELVVITPYVNYNGEKIIEVQGRRLGIYRSYIPPDSDQIELYCQGKAGVSDGGPQGAG